MSDSLRPHELQHARPLCPSPTPRAYPNSCPLYYCDTIPLPYADSNSIIYYSFFEWFVSHILKKTLRNITILNKVLQKMIILPCSQTYHVLSCPLTEQTQFFQVVLSALPLTHHSFFFKNEINYFIYLPDTLWSWRRRRLPTPVFWPREFHELYSPWGCKQSDMTERLSLTL